MMQPSTRLAWAALLALLLGLRVIASAGYMPMVEHGRLTVALCPDGEWTAPAAAMLGMDHHGSKPAHRSECPYAAAAATPFASGDAVPALLLFAIAFAVLAIFALPRVRLASRFERPFSTGPPIPA